MNLKSLLAEPIIERLRPNQVVGAGTGTTVTAILKVLGKEPSLVPEGVVFVPTSLDTAWTLERFNLPQKPLNSVSYIDWSFDGADEVDNELNALKGQGGALLKEKIAAELSKHYVLVVDKSKLVPSLGFKTLVPVEVIPDALFLAKEKLKELSKEVTLRSASKKHGAVITENGNLLIDIKLSNISSETAD
ncbi:MAG: ribose 5-phosphate isomerase A, partial [Candidatus Dadabacteria bacterium]